MAQKRENFLRISSGTDTMGLDLSGARDQGSEQALWRADNVYIGAGKTINKRPKAVTWGTPVLEPTYPMYSSDQILDLNMSVSADWAPVSTSGNHCEAAFYNSMISASGWGAEGEEVYSDEKVIGRPLKSSDSWATLDANELSFIFRANGAVLINGAYISYATKQNEMRTIFFDSRGMNLLTGSGTYTTLLSSSDIIMDGAPHLIRINIAADDTLTIYVDNVLMGSSEVAKWGYFESTSSYYMTIKVTSSGSMTKGNYSYMFSNIFLCDGEDRFYAPEISDIASIKNVRSSGISEYQLVAAGQRYIFVDYATIGIWQPLLKKDYDKTFITQFRDSLVFINYTEEGNYSSVWEYKLAGSVTRLEDAPNAKFGCEFANRLWLAGDPNYPKRVYYSGDRNLETWVVPGAQVIPEEDLLDAGYFDIPAKGHDAVTLLDGKFYDMIIIATDNSIWGVSGASPEDFYRRVVSGDIGAAGSKGGISSMNDFMVLGNNGISSLVTTDKHGDIEAARRTYNVGQLFDVHNIGPNTLNQKYLYRSGLAFMQAKSLLFMAVPPPNKRTLDNVYLLSFPEMQWFGPWSGDEITCIRSVVASVPTAEYIMFGTPNGEVKYYGFLRPNTATAKLYSKYIDGRSLDPALVSMSKSWKHLRFTFNPTGNWPITIKWKTDQGDWNTVTKYLVTKTAQYVGDNAKTGTTLTADRSEKEVIEIPLDVRGRSLKFEISTAAPKLSGVSWEVDFHVSGFEKEE